MRKSISFLTILFLSIGFFFSGAGLVYAAPGAVSLFDPIQFPSSSKSISGVRANFIYGNHRDLTGIDFGLVANQLQGDLKGVQFGLYNGVRGNAGGVQLGALNHIGRDAVAYQFGAINFVDRHNRGAQLGVYNQALSIKGVQFGVINVARSLDGVQIGALNFNFTSRSSFPTTGPAFLPVFNWSF